MKAIYYLDIKTYSKSFQTYLVLFSLLCLGIFSGSKFNLHAGEGIFLNSPYTIGFMLGMLSLSVIFIATIIGSQLLFKEWDSRFDILLFATPITKKQFTIGRFLSFYMVTLLGFVFLTAGFAIGQLMRTGSDMQYGFHLLYFIYPLLVFGVVNSLFVCSLLSLVAWVSRNKLLVAVSGLLLYILYMVILLFSSSPFMAQSMPQSQATQYVAALADPFGISAFFYESSNFTVTERNNTITALSGSFLINRLWVTVVSFILLLIGLRSYRFSAEKSKEKKRTGKKITFYTAATTPDFPYQPIPVAFTTKEKYRSVLSFFKTDTLYIFKGRVLPITTLALLFFLGMEMYAEIEKGIRLPAKFASSGLMATSILENFHTLGLLLVVYYCNDIYWRSKVARFHLLEEVTPFATTKITGHWLSMVLLILFFTLMNILLGLCFQVFYQYTLIDISAYAGVILFNSFPLILLAGLVLLLNKLIPHKYLALGISLLLSIAIASPLANKFISSPLFRFLTAFTGEYSDFNGYGVYASSFAQRLLFGTGLLFFAWWLHEYMATKKIQWARFIITLLILLAGLFSGNWFMTGYDRLNKETILDLAADYEKQYRKFQSAPQPVITDVRTNIHLYPSANSYEIEGVYILENKSNTAIQNILIQFEDAFEIKTATLLSGGETIKLNNKQSEISLQHPLAPGDTSSLHFTIGYKWYPANGHQSFNAIIENGSFMRISRYYPKIGYQADREITDEQERIKRGLGKATAERKLDDPRTNTDDFIRLTMQVDTDADQTVAGSGELVKQWSKQGRNYFRFQPSSLIPFRFALSSAKYATVNTVHDSVAVHVLYHPKHGENVAHLVNNIKQTLDYCRTNFGPYPYSSITFAEISSFTRGFAATAYPATVFMPENMVFHANIKADQQQDVINELAGHELAHLWWGGNQLVPDDREGAALLTETLAMYTEMMLYKKMHGKEKMMQRLQMHQQIYDAEKGFSTNQPLYKVSGNNTHISYSKGAVIMVQLSELIGEATVNKALKQLLHRVHNSGLKAISTDLVDELIAVSDDRYHKQIKMLFMDI
jgi:ABC-2 type transport system permease protein